MLNLSICSYVLEAHGHTQRTRPQTSGPLTAGMLRIHFSKKPRIGKSAKTLQTQGDESSGPVRQKIEPAGGSGGSGNTNSVDDDISGIAGDNFECSQVLGKRPQGS